MSKGKWRAKVWDSGGLILVEGIDRGTREELDALYGKYIEKELISSDVMTAVANRIGREINTRKGGK